MRRAVYCLPLALLFLANALPSNAQKEASVETSVTVRAGAPLKVECALRPEQRVEWRLDGGQLPADVRPAGEVSAGDGRLVATARAPAARPHHAGLYTCSRDRRQAVHVTVDSVTPSAHPPQHTSPIGTGEASVTSDDDAPIVVFDVKGNITLTCTIAGDSKDPIIWKKNGTVVDTILDLKDRYKLDGNTFNISRRAHEDDYGNYSCSAAGAEQQWRVHARPLAKLSANANVVEGQKLKLVCKVIGKPYPRVRWTYSNTSEEVANSTDVVAALGGRPVLQRSEQGVEDAELIVEAADRTDAGRYWCHAGDDAAASVLRVKDMYAALWPFLGICAEVFILCAIILVYEKRRTKPELDDSDTDNHDQKKS